MTGKYSRTNPFLASIKERYSLCKPGSQKNTQHIVIDLSKSGIQYAVGDSVGILPNNDPELVQRMLDEMGATGEEIVKHKRSGERWSFREFLTKHANIKGFSKKFISELLDRQSDLRKKEVLEELLEKNGKEKFKEFQQLNEVYDVLEQHKEVVFSPQELCDILMPMLPRFYSIASSRNMVGEEVQLTVALHQCNFRGVPRLGVCSHYLCNLAPLYQQEIPVFIHPHNGFTLPEDPHASIIMIGPGTGIAPFRSFMQEREWLNCSGKNWLFFGEWNRHSHFFYEDYWKSLKGRGKLRLEVAFSRDQAHKIYVQHRMLEQGKELYRWLEEGAYLYVCGNASHMAKDVDTSLHKIVQQYGNLNEENAKLYVKKLRADKRYLRDVY